MTNGVVLAVLLAISLAQVFPSCRGQGETVIGWVEAKYYHGRRESYVVVINNVEHNVPDEFYNEVEIGDLVKNERGIWSIVRRRAS